jgi:hypothetical protein
MQLIKGTYSKEDALEIVQQIINVKVNFHHDKISLSDNEEDIKMRENRIKNLQNDLANFRMALNKHQGAINMNALLDLNKAGLEVHDFSLINGSFDLEDAYEILNNAYNAKINFHQLKAFSKRERGEAGADLHNARALELEMELSRVKELLTANYSNGKKVNITCSVSLEFESENAVNVREQNLVHSY